VPEAVRPGGALFMIFENHPDKTLLDLPIEHLKPFRYQVRIKFVAADLEELAQSIRESGVVQPLVVRRLDGAASAPFYEIIAGERRWRAAQRAGLHKITVIIRELSDQQACTINLVENIQRENLNAIEEGRGFLRLKEYGLRLEEIGQKTGRNMSSVSHMIRLLNLEQEVQDFIEAGDLNAGHGKALLRLSGKQQIAAAKEASSQGLNVRQLEHHVQKLLKPVSSPEYSDPDIRQLENELSELLGTQVKVKGSAPFVFEVQAHNLEIAEGIIEHIRRGSKTFK